jgi:endonuclease/exonuclease/phosphatase family metal-dependent hydrolase
MQDAPDSPLKQTDEEALLAHERDALDAIAIEAVPPAARRLRMATYNIHKGVSAMSRHNRIHELRAGLHALEADLVFLQEVQGRNDLHAGRFDNWPDIAQHTFLAGDRWAESAYGRNSVRDDGDHGNAVLSRFPILSHENIDISDHRFESRGLLHCVFDFDGTDVHCICAHLGLFEGSRLRQADAMIARIRSHVPADAPLVIAGDFNDWRHRLGKRLVDNLGVREVFSGHETRRAALVRRLRKSLAPRTGDDASTDAAVAQPTKLAQPARTFPSAFPLLRLDRIYVRGLRIASAKVLSGPTWARLSDHAPIVAELVLDPA